MATDMFLKIEGVEGEARNKGHEKSIEILAWSWGMSQSGSTHSGTGSGVGRSDVQDLSITKYVDNSSAQLQLACLKGRHFAKGTLTMQKAGGDDPVKFIVIELTDFIVSSVSLGGSGGEDRLTENLTLNFAQVKYEYQAQNAKGAKEGAAKNYTFNIPENNTK